MRRSHTVKAPKRRNKPALGIGRREDQSPEDLQAALEQFATIAEDLKV